MVSLSPKRLRTKLLDRFKQSTSRQSSSTQVIGKPIPIFETTLAKATIASRIDRDPLTPALATTSNATAPTADATETTMPTAETDLDSLYRYWCPAVVYRCITYLSQRGLDEEGLYRVPGSSETIKLLRHEFNCRGDVDLTTIVLRDVHHEIQLADIASLLKQYLRELPGPIISGDTVKILESVIVAGEEDLTRLRQVLSSTLQPYEFYLLSMLCRHLATVDAHHGTNKMDMHNLSIVFCSSSNLGIGTNLFAALARESVWINLRCANEESALAAELATS